MTRVMIVDDQDIIRVGLAMIIDSQPDFTVVAQATDGFSAVRAVHEMPIDVVLMDLRMPGIDGVETVRRIRADHARDKVRLLVFTTFDQDENVLRAIRAGADGFLSKSASPTEIATAIQQVAEGGRALSAVAMSAIVDHVADNRQVVIDETVAAKFAMLTTREREVVEAIVSGLGNAEIAANLHLSPFTVKTHSNRAMAKIGVSDRGQLVSQAVRAGIMP